MFHLSLICLTFISLTIANKIRKADVPFRIDEKGRMWLNISGKNYTLTKNLNLRIKDDHCTTKIDLSRANEKEKEAKKGIRHMIV
ncbi:hypothetical protein EWB00_006278 [Schistosoma japonicum]|nr:hypothetical protein EWB00_006278 [Schistosoma japonicum]